LFSRKLSSFSEQEISNAGLFNSRAPSLKHGARKFIPNLVCSEQKEVAAGFGRLRPLKDYLKCAVAER
jgi:hypothetical protein